MRDWTYDTAEDIDQSVLERLQRIPREPDMLVYGARYVTAILVRTWMRLYHRLTLVGIENLPAEGSYVLVANHASHLDTLGLLSAFPVQKLHRVFPAAAKDFFFVTVPRVAITAVMINALPFDRYTNVRQSLSLCRSLLERPNTVLLIFPEGTRSTDGGMGEFKPGIGYLLAGTEYPVLPCHIQGTYETLPKGRWVPRPGRIQVTIGQPRRYTHLKRCKASVTTICNDLRDDIHSLAAGISAPSNSDAVPEDDT